MSGLRKGASSEEEDVLLRNTVAMFGQGKWHRIPDRAGLNRCRKSCRLSWFNYLKPDIKRGNFSSDEVDLIIRLHKLLGNRWSLIAGRSPGRTANDVKNYWNSHLFKKLQLAGRIPEPKQFRQAKNITTDNIIRRTATKNTHNIVVRPIPRSFSKDISTGYIIPDVPVKDNISLPAPAKDPATSVQFHEPATSNSMQYWWDHLFADDVGQASLVAPGLAESPDITRLFPADGASGNGFHGSDSNQEGGGYGSTIFPPESELWDFLLSDNNNNF